MATDLIRVEVAYAKPQQQSLIEIDLPLGSTIEQAIQASGILQQFPDIDLTQQKVGIFSRIGKLQQRLNDGDRVEIYRSLAQDPMAARRNRL